MTASAGTGGPRVMGAALVTEANVDALVEAYTAVAMVAWSGRRAGYTADLLAESRWRDGRPLRVPTIGAREDPDEGHVVVLEGLAFSESLALVVAGIALRRIIPRLVDDDDVPGELTGALVALRADLEVMSRQRALRLAAAKLGTSSPTGRSGR